MSFQEIALLIFALGFVTGLRSMMGVAVVAWAAHLRWFSLADTPVAFMGSRWALYVFSAAAIGELIADKLPFVPRRTSAAPLVARAALGALCGASLMAAAGLSLWPGAVIGLIGAVVGAFAGYSARHWLVSSKGWNDSLTATLEDLIAIGVGLAAVSRM